VCEPCAESLGIFGIDSRLSDCRPNSRRFEYLNSRLLQLRVLRLGLLQDRDIGVDVLPQREEIVVGGERPDAGGIGVRAARGSRLQGVGSSHSQAR
jgi:hypothetical protein